MSFSSALSSLAGIPAAWNLTSPADRIAQALDSLGAALEAGDIVAAVKAFTSLQTQLSTPSQTAALLSKYPQAPEQLSTLRQALDSGDTAAAHNASTALRRNLAAPLAPLPSSSPREPADPATQRPTFAADDTAELSPLSSALQKAAAAPTAAPPLANPNASLDYVVNLFPGPPDSAPLANRATQLTESLLPSALAAQEAARLGVQFNPGADDDLGPSRSALPAWLILAPAAALLLWLFL